MKRIREPAIGPPPKQPKHGNGEWTRETSKPRNEDRPLPNPQRQSQRPQTVEVPIAWLEKLVELSEQVSNIFVYNDSKFANLKGYIESAKALIGDKSE